MLHVIFVSLLCFSNDYPTLFMDCLFYSKLHTININLSSSQELSKCFQIDFTTFFMATSIVPTRPPSIRLKATRLTPASMTAMQNLFPITFARSMDTLMARLAFSRFILFNRRVYEFSEFLGVYSEYCGICLSCTRCPLSMFMRRQKQIKRRNPFLYPAWQHKINYNL